jgi:serine/threonine protein phosphatase 1
MIHGFLKSIQSPKAKPSVPDGVRLFVIGDIHGRHDLLAILSNKIDTKIAHTPAARNILIFLGDYIDRGVHSKEVIEHIIALKNRRDIEVIALKGNHEDRLLVFLENSATGASWFRFGGEAAVLSYGIKPATKEASPSYFTDIQTRLKAAMPQTHLEFLSNLPVTAECGDYFFVHAGVNPAYPLNRQNEADLIWIRETFLSSQKDFGKIIVHGHSIQFDVEFKPNRIGIDTGAYATGKLTCLVLEGENRELI